MVNLVFKAVDTSYTIGCELGAAPSGTIPNLTCDARVIEDSCDNGALCVSSWRYVEELDTQKWLLSIKVPQFTGVNSPLNDDSILNLTIDNEGIKQWESDLAHVDGGGSAVFVAATGNSCDFSNPTNKCQQVLPFSYTPNPACSASTLFYKNAQRPSYINYFNSPFDKYDYKWILTLMQVECGVMYSLRVNVVNMNYPFDIATANSTMGIAAGCIEQSIITGTFGHPDCGLCGCDLESTLSDDELFSEAYKRSWNSKTVSCSTSIFSIDDDNNTYGHYTLTKIE